MGTECAAFMTQTRLWGHTSVWMDAGMVWTCSWTPVWTPLAALHCITWLCKKCPGHHQPKHMELSPSGGPQGKPWLTDAQGELAYHCPFFW